MVITPPSKTSSPKTNLFLPISHSFSPLSYSKTQPSTPTTPTLPIPSLTLTPTLVDLPSFTNRTPASREMGGTTTPDKDTAWAFARSWVNGWNTRNLDEIMSHYASDVEFWSPTVCKRWGIQSGKLLGKSKLREHFEKGLKTPKLRFELIDVLPGVNGMTILYRRENGAFVVDVVELDEQGKGKNIRAYIGAPRV